MLDRNKRIKARPERFQSCKDQFDLVITCEERVYDQVLEGECQSFHILAWMVEILFILLVATLFKPDDRINCMCFSVIVLCSFAWYYINIL